jgi:hypothetical protein
LNSRNTSSTQHGTYGKKAGNLARIASPVPNSKRRVYITHAQTPRTVEGRRKQDETADGGAQSAGPQFVEKVYG